MCLTTIAHGHAQTIPALFAARWSACKAFRKSRRDSAARRPCPRNAIRISIAVCIEAPTSQRDNRRIDLAAHAATSGSKRRITPTRFSGNRQRVRDVAHDLSPPASREASPQYDLSQSLRKLNRGWFKSRAVQEICIRTHVRRRIKSSTASVTTTKFHRAVISMPRPSSRRPKTAILNKTCILLTFDMFDDSSARSKHQHIACILYSSA